MLFTKFISDVWNCVTDKDFDFVVLNVEAYQFVSGPADRLTGVGTRRGSC